jgi:hypothetical protein
MVGKMAKTKLVTKAAPMGKKTKIALLVVGAAALVTAVVLLLRNKVSANPNPPPGGNNLKVTLTGLDPAATVWEMTIFDHDYTAMLQTPGQDIPVTTPASFNVPTIWTMPLKIMIAVFKPTPGDPSSLTQILDVQSYNTTNPFTGQPDPTYSPIFISTIGNITFNCGTKIFES